MTSKTSASKTPSKTGRPLAHLDIETLTVSSLNVRRHGAKEIGDFTKNIAALGILQPLLVRATAGGHEVIAGKRRFLAASKLHAQGNTDFASLPVLILEPEDDAAAIEASLAENIARLPMDEMDQYEAFAQMIDNGRSVEDVATHFAVTEQTVQKRMALARLNPQIRALYRKGEIDARTLRLLTLATSQRQKAWLDVVRDPEAEQPPFWQLKAWLLGGAEIPIAHAIFDLEQYPGAITRDLFDDADASYFADSDAFWTLQNAAIAKLAEELAGNDWPVSVINPDQRFTPHDWIETTKKDGGQALIIVERDGTVTVKKGLLSRTAAKARQKAAGKATRTAALTEPGANTDAISEQPQISDRPELSGPLANYIDLVRLSSLQLAVTRKPQVAVRLMLAHVITGHGNWSVTLEPMTTHSGEIAAAIDMLPDRVAYKKLADETAEKLGHEPGSPLIETRDLKGERITAVFEQLTQLSDAQVMKLLAAVMAGTLEPGTPLVDTLGTTLAVTPTWTGEGNTTFLDLVRDREVTRAMLRDVSGEAAERANYTATGKLMKEIITQSLTGNGRRKVSDWMPPWLRFPQAQYTKRKLKA